MFFKIFIFHIILKNIIPTTLTKLSHEGLTGADAHSSALIIHIYHTAV